MISAQLLLPTKALYFSPDWDQFNSIKEAFLQKNMAYLPSMSIEYKWKTLITKFADAVPYLDRSHFYNFRDSRGRESVANPHVLDLSKVLDYFENFYFLYCNNHPNYQLSKEAKDSLLRNIIAGMVPGACEPGRVTQFENGLQKSRKDTDWILCELICHRDNIIHEIADEYNVKHCISQGYSIHTKMHMSMLARQFNLGVTPLQEVDDCYLRYTAKKQMASYFEQVFRIKFDEYEANAITNLSQHVMLELTDWLQHHQVNLAKWDKETITLTEGQLVSFHQFIPTFFEDKNAYNFGELAEDGVSYVLKNKHELYTEIQHCVKERLLQKGCFLNVSITDNLLENALVLEDVLWAQGVTKEDFKLYIQALRTFSLKADHSTTFFQTHPHVVAAYPSLIIPALTEHSELWASLPKLLRYNLQFIEALVKAIGQQLLVVKLDDEAILVELLLKITRANPEILSQLPAKVLDTKSIALKLVSRNGLLLRWLSTNLKADPQVMAVSCKQNQQAEIYTVSHEVLRAKTSECLKRISVRLSSHIMDCLRSSEDVYVLFEKAQHTEILLETKVISTGKLARLAQVLTPKELDAIAY